jgi:hypothetical protein
MDHLQEMLPEEVKGNPMAQMLVTFMREAKKDLRRLPVPFVETLSKTIGDAFSWVAEGDLSETPDLDSDVEELLSSV